MNRWITSAKLIVLGAFFVASLATLGYEWRYVWPVRACEQKGAWWDERDRQCLTPMPIWRITHRLPATVAAGAPSSRR
ncbi:MAG: hypothetical protein ABI376_07830 [Caulobacteraceae bacterium]